MRHNQRENKEYQRCLGYPIRKVTILYITYSFTESVQVVVAILTTLLLLATEQCDCPDLHTTVDPIRSRQAFIQQCP